MKQFKIKRHGMFYEKYGYILRKVQGSPYPHYLCKVMHVNDNGMMEVRWAVGYIDKDTIRKCNLLTD